MEPRKLPDMGEYFKHLEDQYGLEHAPEGGETKEEQIQREIRNSKCMVETRYDEDYPDPYNPQADYIDRT